MRSRRAGLIAVAAVLATAWLAHPAGGQRSFTEPLPFDPAAPTRTSSSPAVRETEHERVDLVASQDAVRPGDRFYLAIRCKFLQPKLQTLQRGFEWRFPEQVLHQRDSNDSEHHEGPGRGNVVVSARDYLYENSHLHLERSARCRPVLASDQLRK